MVYVVCAVVVVVVVGAVLLAVYAIRVLRGRFAGSSLSQVRSSAAEGIFTGRRGLMQSLASAAFNYFGRSHLQAAYLENSLMRIMMQTLTESSSLQRKCVPCSMICPLPS